MDGYIHNGCFRPKRKYVPREGGSSIVSGRRLAEGREQPTPSIPARPHQRGRRPLNPIFQQNGPTVCLGHVDEPQLLQCPDAVVQPYLFDDLTVLEAQHSRTGEMHLPTRCGR